jgi:CheY-like chemotaxis protein
MKKRMGRILLVDDDQEWLDELSETLQGRPHKREYYVETASTIEEARHKLANALFHLIILDIRMQNSNRTNAEGIDLLHEIHESPLGKGIKVIMLSALTYRQPRYMQTAYREHAVDVLDKSDFDNEEFLQSLSKIFEQDVKVNLGLEIAWQRGIKPKKVVIGLEMGDECIDEQSPLQDAMAVELDDLLCRLFFKAKHVLVNRVSSGHSGTGVLFARPVFEPGPARALIVKFGETQRINTEFDNFKHYAEGFIGGGHNTTVYAVANTPHLGGIVYSLLGVSNDRLEDFGEFYHHASQAQIKSMLQRLFKGTCGSWYSSPGKQDALHLSQKYPQQLHFTWEKLRSSFANLCDSVYGEKTMIFRELTYRRAFTNPIIATEGQSLTYLTYTCTTHGDFNQNNILVDNKGVSWLIDFQDTGPGHIFRDIAALDTEIRCKLLRPEEATLDELLEMEEALCTMQNFSQLDKLATRYHTQNPALAKIHDLVVYLRTLAYDLTPNHEDTMDEYYTALLYNALNTSRFRTLSTRQREHALLSASLLVDKLGLRG